MPTDKPTSRFVQAHNVLRRSKILGDVGLGAIAALGIALVVYFTGGGEEYFGMPVSFVFGSIAFVAVTAMSSTLGWMPDSDPR